MRRGGTPAPGGAWDGHHTAVPGAKKTKKGVSLTPRFFFLSWRALPCLIPTFSAPPRFMSLLSTRISSFLAGAGLTGAYALYQLRNDLWESHALLAKQVRERKEGEARRGSFCFVLFFPRPGRAPPTPRPRRPAAGEEALARGWRSLLASPPGGGGASTPLPSPLARGGGARRREEGRDLPHAMPASARPRESKGDSTAHPCPRRPPPARPGLPPRLGGGVDDAPPGPVAWIAGAGQGRALPLCVGLGRARALNGSPPYSHPRSPLSAGPVAPPRRPRPPGPGRTATQPMHLVGWGGRGGRAGDAAGPAGDPLFFGRRAAWRRFFRPPRPPLIFFASRPPLSLRPSKPTPP